MQSEKPSKTSGLGPLSWGLIAAAIAALIVGVTTMNRKPSTAKPQPSPQPSNDLDVMLDPGHGGRDPGVVTGSITEKAENLEMALTLKHILETEHKLRVGLTRTSDTYPELLQRTNMAEQAKAEVFVSCHYDIVTPGERWGCYHDGKASSLNLARAISMGLDGVNGSRGAWVRSHTASRFGRLYIADFNRGPSVLVEFGPIRNAQEAERLRMAKAIAPAIARAVAAQKGV